MTMKKIIADSCMVSRMQSKNTRRSIRRFTRPTISAPNAPTAPPSVGENSPANMPPITRTNSAPTPQISRSRASRAGHAVRAPAGPIAGRRRIHRCIAIMYRAIDTMPGTMPAANSFPTDVSVRKP